MNRLKISTGILLLILNTGIWINGLFINRERGMDIIVALPLLIAGAFLLLSWYKTSAGSKPTKAQSWKFILRCLLLNYSVLYIIYMISDIIFWAAIDFMNLPGIILPILLTFFITGFILAWKHEFFAGIFFLAWYLLVLFAQIRYDEILNRGPYILLGLVILLHGILYIIYSLKIKTEE